MLLVFVAAMPRITPAHAGTSGVRLAKTNSLQDHPRTRGDKLLYLVNLFCMKGSPPHTRGQVSSVADVVAPTGITPAHAGTSDHGHDEERNQEDHPRTRGDKLLALMVVYSLAGSPPHTRGQGF